MTDFLKEAAELKQQYYEMAEKIKKLYEEHWDKLIGRYFYYPSKDIYIKVIGFGKAMLGGDILLYRYCEKEAKHCSWSKSEYVTKTDYFVKHNIPIDLVEISEQEYLNSVEQFFNEAKDHLTNVIESEE